MMLPRALQAPTAVALSAMVAWAFAQLSGPWALPPGLATGTGIVAGIVLFALWGRERRAVAESAPAGASARDAEFFPVEISRAAAGWITVGLVGVALALRFHGLLDRPAWEDEMWTLRNFYSADLGELLRVAFDDYWPPLHYLILNTVARIADTSLVWIRSPSVLFGSATVAAIYWLGRDLFGRRSAGLWAATLLTGMTAHVLYSQEARVYAMQVFLAVLSARYFYRSFHEKRISPAFLITTTLLTYSHSFASWYFIAGQCVYVAIAWLLWRDGEQFRKGFLSQLAVLLLWMPLVAAFAYSRLARDIVVPTYWATGPEVPMGWFDVVELYQSLVVRSWAGAAFTALLFALALIPLVRGRRADDAAAASEAGAPAGTPAGTDGDASRDAYVKAIVFLLCWITVPIAFSYVVSAVTTLDTFGATRYHLTVLPALCLLMTAGLAMVRSRVVLTAAVLMAILLPAAQLKRHYRDFAANRADVEAAADLVRARGARDEPVYIGNTFRAFAYYDRGIFPRIGSEQWDSLAAAHAHLTDVYTMESVKRGDTYAYEKIDPRIRYFGWYGGQGPGRIRFLEEQAAAGGFDGSFWFVLSAEGDTVVREALESGRVPCRDRSDYAVTGLEMIHCRNGGSGTSPGAPSGSGL
jgi:hypothetical protein